MRSRLLGALLVVGLSSAAALLGHVASATPAHAPAARSAAADGRGRTLYYQDCASCHGQGGEGSQRGPALRDVGAAAVDFYLTTGRMPLRTEKDVAKRGSAKYDRADIDDLVAFVMSFGGHGPGIPTVSAGDLNLGRDVYLQNCAGCHSSAGVGYAQVGGRAAPSLLQDTPRQVAEATRIGPSTMPQFPESALDQEQLDAVTSYVLQLQHGPDRGGARLGRLGPVPETLVSFLVLAGLMVVLRGLGKRSG